MEFFYRVKAFHAGKKNQENDLPPQKSFLLRPWVHTPFHETRLAGTIIFTYIYPCLCIIHTLPLNNSIVVTVTFSTSISSRTAGAEYCVW